MNKIFFWRKAEPTKLQKLTNLHEELFDELQHAKIQFAKWKHTLNLKNEEFKRVTKEMEEMLAEDSAKGEK